MSSVILPLLPWKIKSQMFAVDCRKWPDRDSSLLWIFFSSHVDEEIFTLISLHMPFAFEAF